MTVPTSTYRLQIRESLTLDDAAELLDYLAELGVGAVYLSPLLTSTRGSDHGYDVTDPTAIDPQRGGADGWHRLLDAAEQAGLAVVIDIVPNHLGIERAQQNPAWWDVLTYGRRSRYADWFDIDWTAPKLKLPILGAERDALDQLRVEDGQLCYWEHRFPIAPGTAQAGTAQQIHDQQHYRLVSHRLANTELGYRRFFAVSTLAGVRVEDRQVFDATHVQVAAMINDGAAGIRVDHPDGLADPAGYLQRLRQLAPEGWITVEKILEPGETLPDWPVSGTTGYDALAAFTGVFIDPSAEEEMTAIYQRITADRVDVDDQLLAGKRLVLETMFGSELRRLARLAPDVPRARDLLTEAAAHFAVYRSYLPDGIEHTVAALDQVRSRVPELAGTADRLQPRLTDATDELAIRFQQLTGAVLAKGVEDTACYRYNRLIALNEVGGDLARFGVGPEAFHAAQEDRATRRPATMTTLSTHDTKRSEDVRAWVAALSEHPADWEHFCRHLFDALPLPEPTIGYLLWQTVAAVGLIEPERLHGYAEKAMREAALGTSWLEVDTAFEDQVHGAIDQLYGSAELRSRVDDFRRTIAPTAISNLLGQKLLQLTAPGVPDLYQGTELTDDSLVDPDNRRPVDFAARRRLLADLASRPAPRFTDCLADIGGADTDLAKLWIVSQALRARAEVAGDTVGYRPVTADGPAAQHLLGFRRGSLITLATRLPAALAADGGWRRTTLTLPPGRWRDRLTDSVHTGTVSLDSALSDYPVALLSHSAPSDSASSDWAAADTSSSGA